jgi:hypothetical protein
VHVSRTLIWYWRSDIRFSIQQLVCDRSVSRHSTRQVKPGALTSAAPNAFTTNGRSSSINITSHDAKVQFIGSAGVQDTKNEDWPSAGVGRTVGIGVGDKVGSEVGAKVGVAVGIDVGNFVGSDVGFLLGVEVGEKVGTSVELVGASVGASVGVCVGLLVGR